MGESMNIPLRNPKKTMSFSTFLIESRHRQRRCRVTQIHVTAPTNLSERLANNKKMKNPFTALSLQDKIFSAYGIVFLLMFGLIFGITHFLIRLAFDRQIEAYVEELESEVSNNYTLLVAKMRKEVASIAEAPALHSAILKGQSDGIRYLRDTEFDVLEYGTAYGTLLASTWMEDPRIGTNVMRRGGAGRTRGTGIALRESGNGNIRLRKVEQNGGIEPRLVVEVTQAGDWGFLTGRRLLSKWMETETAIRSDEHAIFLVQENHSPIGEVSTTSRNGKVSRETFSALRSRGGCRNMDSAQQRLTPCACSSRRMGASHRRAAARTRTHGRTSQSGFAIGRG